MYVLHVPIMHVHGNRKHVVQEGFTVVCVSEGQHNSRCTVFPPLCEPYGQTNNLKETERPTDRQLLVKVVRATAVALFLGV